MKYVGWIPNVAGRLSYTALGNCHHIKDSVGAAVLCPTMARRFIIAHQRRQLTDVPWKSDSIAKIFGINGKFDFSFIGQTKKTKLDNFGDLVGRVYIRPVIDRKDTYKDRLWSLTKETALSLLSEKEKIQRIEEIRRTASRNNYIYATIRIRRNGECVIVASQDRIKNTRFQSGLSIDDIASQIYFFLRDISHRHQHHPASSDNVLNVYRIGDDIKWRRECVYSIYRKVVSSRRFKDVRLLYDALGLLAYANSSERVLLPQNEGKGRLYDAVDIKASVEAILRREADNLTRHRWQVSAIIALASVMIATTFQIRNIYQPQDAGWFVRSIMFIYEMNFQVILVIPAIIFVLQITKIVDITKSFYFREATRLVNTFPRDNVILVSSIILAALWLSVIGIILFGAR